MKENQISALPGNVLGLLADLCDKLQQGVITTEELRKFLKKQNPFNESGDIAYPVAKENDKRKDLCLNLKDRIIETWNRFSNEGYKMSHRYTPEEWEEALGVKPLIYKEKGDVLVIFNSPSSDEEFLAVPLVAAYGWKTTLTKWFLCERHEGYMTELIKPAILTASGAQDIKYLVKEKGKVSTD